MPYFLVYELSRKRYFQGVVLQRHLHYPGDGTLLYTYHTARISTIIHAMFWLGGALLHRIWESEL